MFCLFSRGNGGIDYEVINQTMNPSPGPSRWAVTGSHPQAGCAPGALLIRSMDGSVRSKGPYGRGSRSSFF